MTTLRQRMAEDMRMRNLSLSTQKKYLRQVAVFADYFNKSPSLLGAEQVLDYLGRYTHRIAISNNRLLKVKHGNKT
jgi:hypothetical protein